MRRPRFSLPQICPFSSLLSPKCLSSSVAKSGLTLCSPMGGSPAGSSVHGIPQARILEGVAISFSRGSFLPRNLLPWQADSLRLSQEGSPQAKLTAWNSISRVELFHREMWVRNLGTQEVLRVRSRVQSSSLHLLFLYRSY